VRPRLLDLFCGAGGAAVGYHRAGFDMVGVDIRPQPNYPFEFVQADALLFMKGLLGPAWGGWELGEFDAIHASPPCQAYSYLRVLWREREHPDLIDATRNLLRETGLPYVIENVVGSPLPRQNDLFGAYGVELCGSMFGLKVRRHRLFETNFPIEQPACRHQSQRAVVGVYGHTGAGANRGRARARGDLNGIAEWSNAMGIDWMTCNEIAEAIPPAYTELIGHQLMQHLRVAA
jgi:DNA (cytosine-5)-methyltransferase 1